MGYSTKEILRDQNGVAIPQIWDEVLDDFVPYEGKVTLSGIIYEYQWLDTDTPPVLGAEDRAFGVEINTTTHEMTIKYWTGSAWQEVA